MRSSEDCRGESSGSYCLAASVGERIPPASWGQRRGPRPPARHLPRHIRLVRVSVLRSAEPREPPLASPFPSRAIPKAWPVAPGHGRRQQ